MDADKFVYWLQGFVELADTPTISEAQWKMIKEHLKLVFKKVTPPLGFPPVNPAPLITPMPVLPPQPAWEPRITCSTQGVDNLMKVAIC